MNIAIIKLGGSMKTKSCVLILFLLPVLFGVGCSNTLLPYHKDYADRKIQAVLYVPDLPVGGVDLPLLQSALYSKDIQKAFDEYLPSGKNAIEEVFESKSVESSKIKVITDKNFLSTKIPPSSATEDALKENPSLIRYDFSKISGHPEYIFEFRVVYWKEVKSGMSVGLALGYDVSIYDTSKNVKIYEYYGSGVFYSYPGLFSSWTDGNDPKVLDATFRNLISTAIDQTLKELK
jgi:hypothetical protein